MTRTPLFLLLGLGLASLTGCVDDGRGYVESRAINEGPIGRPAYRPAPIVERTVIVDSGPRYSGRGVYREPAYRDRYALPPRYDRDRYDDRGRYDWGDDRFDRRRYCASVRYDDPRCD